MEDWEKPNTRPLPGPVLSEGFGGGYCGLGGIIYVKDEVYANEEWSRTTKTLKALDGLHAL